MDITELLAFSVENNASDLHLSTGVPPSIRVDGDVRKLNIPAFDAKDVNGLVYDIMNDRQRKEYEENLEVDFSFEVPNLARFRVNAFNQNRGPSAVFRTIPSTVLSLEDLGCPDIFREISDTPRGLVLVTGPTGSGKSTTLAAMVDLRNEATHGHIITIEDPIEFTHAHKNCLITQREVGLDTANYEIAMKNTLRQAPDVILLGEVRDRESMEYAIAYAETGHLCLTTLHANSTNQAIDRIINFFPDERREQLLMDLSLNLKAIVSQRLTRKKDGKGRFPAVEVLINTPMMADLILKGDVSGMKELMAKSNQLGMCTFDQALFHMIDAGMITVQEGMRNADSINDLRLKLKLGSRNSKKEDFFKGTDKISIEELYDEAAE